MMIDASLDRVVRSAIERKRLLRARYDGRIREVEPHDYGVQSGVERVLVYQLRATPPKPGQRATGWRLLDLAKLEAWEVLDEPFAGSRGHPK